MGPCEGSSWAPDLWKTCCSLIFSRANENLIKQHLKTTSLNNQSLYSKTQL